MRNKWYWAFKHIFFGPALRVWNRPWSEGMDRIPESGPAILASSHQAVMDSFYFPLLCPCLLYTSPSPRDQRGSRMPSSA